MRRTVPVALALAGVALPVTAHAAHAERLAGFTCGFASTDDPVGAAEPDPGVYYGEIHGGPFLVTSDGPPVLSVTITCSIQIGSVDPAAPDAVSVSATGSGNVAVLAPTAMTYRARPGEDVALCMRVDWVTRDGTGTWHFDTWDGDPDVQCALGTGPERPFDQGGN